MRAPSRPEDLPEADAAPGAQHPRHARKLHGQERAEAEFLAAFRSGRLHHGWLLCGPQGIGKATLAWRIARFLLDGPGFGGALVDPAPESLSIDPEGSTARQVAALSHPGLFLLRRAWDFDRKRLKTVIDVDEARRMKQFLQQSAGHGGRRVVIVDAADELNLPAANAILKVLEEPPRDTVFLMVSHAPSRLLPTIRSRCRSLTCAPLAADALELVLATAGHPPGDDPAALTELANGSAGAALRLVSLDGPATYHALARFVRSGRNLDRQAVIAFADRLGARGQEEQADLAVSLASTLMGRIARCGAGRLPNAEAFRGESQLLPELAPGIPASRAWADAQQEISEPCSPWPCRQS